MGAVVTRNLGKDYGARVALVGLDLEIPEGSIFGLLGPNGAGKTTAIAMICGVVTPSRGTAAVMGRDLRAEPRAARRALGYAPQEIALYDDLSAEQNLRYFGRLYGLRRPRLAERVDDALALAGLRERRREPVAAFSGGMKRRLNLAAAILHRPEVLIVDEPTVGVDPQSRSFLFEAIRRLRAEGKTIVYASHYMEEVEALCDEAAILDRGELIARGTIAEVTAAAPAFGVAVDLEGGGGACRELLAGRDGVEITASGFCAASTRALAAALLDVDEAGVTVRAIRTSERDLQEAFLALTGRRLRDEA